MPRRDQAGIGETGFPADRGLPVHDHDLVAIAGQVPGGCHAHDARAQYDHPHVLRPFTTVPDTARPRSPVAIILPQEAI